jgi:F-type H+-transporting ATPase subunit b
MLPNLLLWISLAAAPALAAPEGEHTTAGAEHAGKPTEGGHGEAAAGAHGQAGHEEGGHGEGTHGPDLRSLGITAVNLALFVGLMWFFAARPVGDALKNRALAVRSGLDEAARMRLDAQKRFSEVEGKLAALGRQVQDLKAEAASSAEKEAALLSERADADATRMQEAAERTLREETNRATGIIRGEAAALAVQLAREILKTEVGRDDQERLARQFLAVVAENEKSSPGAKEADRG